jgi:hypothetical protein
MHKCILLQVLRHQWLKVVSVAFGRASARRCTGNTFDDCYNFGSNVTNIVATK